MSNVPGSSPADRNYAALAEAEATPNVHAFPRVFGPLCFCVGLLITIDVVAMKLDFAALQRGDKEQIINGALALSLGAGFAVFCILLGASTAARRYGVTLALAPCVFGLATWSALVVLDYQVASNPRLIQLVAPEAGANAQRNGTLDADRYFSASSAELLTSRNSSSVHGKARGGQLERRDPRPGTGHDLRPSPTNRRELTRHDALVISDPHAVVTADVISKIGYGVGPIDVVLARTLYESGLLPLLQVLMFSIAGYMCQRRLRILLPMQSLCDSRGPNARDGTCETRQGPRPPLSADEKRTRAPPPPTAPARSIIDNHLPLDSTLEKALPPGFDNRPATSGVADTTIIESSRHNQQGGSASAIANAGGEKVVLLRDRDANRGVQGHSPHVNRSFDRAQGDFEHAERRQARSDQCSGWAEAPELDLVRRFLAQSTRVTPHVRYGATDLFRAFSAWAAVHSEVLGVHMTQNAFGRCLTALGATRTAIRGRVYYLSIGHLRVQRFGDAAPLGRTA